MNTEEKKALMEAYKNRHPEMGVISLHCVATGESFLAHAQDTTASLNSICWKLENGYHPNRILLGRWKQYKRDGFVCSVLKRLDYDDPQKDQRAKLQTLLADCLAADANASMIWK